MKQKIIKALQENPGLKAKEIAKIIGREKKELNPFLYANSDIFVKNKDHEWFLIKDIEVTVCFPSDRWVSCDVFEGAIEKAGCLLSSKYAVVIFVIPDGCKFLLEAMARLLALINQLSLIGKAVKVDFSECPETLNFLNRNGFIDRLYSEVIVIPKRPKASAAKKYEGNSDALLEVCEINPESPDESIPKKLKEKFVSFAGEKYATAALTIIGELFENVCQHSSTEIPGFAALQKYGGHKPHLQTVVSDSGKGIIGTLRPVLEKYYPDVAGEFDFDDQNTEAALLQHVLQKGHLSKTGEHGRGLGLSRSQDYALKYSATISVRQETFQLKLFYKDSRFLRARRKVGMPRIRGTHVCFDFSLD